MLGMAGARRRARQMRFAASRAKSTEQSMDCDVTAPKGSFKHLAQTLVRMQTQRTHKPGDVNGSSSSSGAGYGASRGTYRKKDSDTALKTLWEPTTFPQILLGYSTKYAVHVQLFIIFILAFIATIVLLRGPNQPKNLRNVTNSRTGYSILEFHSAINSDKCTLDRIDVGAMTEEIFIQSYRLQKPFILCHKKGAKSWLDSKLWEIKALLNQLGVLKATRELLDVTMDVMKTEDSTLGICLENILNSLQHINGNQMCFLNDSTLRSSDLLKKLKLPPFQGSQETGYRYTAQVSSIGSSIGWTFSASDMWSGLIHGGKRWLVSPANSSATGASFIGDPHDLIGWIEVDYPQLLQKDAIADCVQKPGDIIYIPELFNFIEIATEGSVALQSTSISLTETGKLYHKVRNTHISSQEHVDNLKKLHQMLPGNLDIILKLAEALEISDQISEAIEILKKSAQQNTNPQLSYKLADLLDKAGRDSEALDIYEEMRKKEHVDPKTYSKFSQFLLGQKKPGEATHLLREAVQKYPSKLYLWDWLISSLRQSGEKAKAKQVEREVKKWRNA